MPFTPTHALAAVPLARVRALTPSALAIGCMVPDLPMFLRGTPSYPTTHSWFLGPLSCLPYGLLAFVLFRLGRGRAIGFASAAVRGRLAPYAAPGLCMSWRAWLSVVVSVALGVWTHIAWDGFTHAHRFGSEILPALDTTWLTVSGHRLPGYKLLQYGSSVLGLPILVCVVARWYERQPLSAEPVAAASTARRVLALMLLVGAPLVAIAIGRNTLEGPRSIGVELLAYDVVTQTIAAYLIGFVALTLPMRWSSTQWWRT